MLGRWASKHGHQGYTSLGSVIHILLGVILTGIGFAQIYLGFKLYERRSGRKVPLAVVIIWAIIIGLFSIYLIALALRMQLTKRQRNSSPKFNRKRKAAIYGSAQSPVASPALDRTMSWEFITGVPSSPASAQRSPEMRQVGAFPASPKKDQQQQDPTKFSAVPVRGLDSFSSDTLQPSAGGSTSDRRISQPFGSLSTLGPFSDANAVVAAPEAAHFAAARRTMSERSGSPTQPLLRLPVVHEPPLVAGSGPGPADSAVSLQAIDEEAAVETGASVSNLTASTGESFQYRLMQQQARARASTSMLPDARASTSMLPDGIASAERLSGGEGEQSGSSREDLLGRSSSLIRRGSAPLPASSADGRRSVASIRRKAVPPLIQ